MEYRDARALLEAPGGMFEMVTEDVLGRPTRVFKNRKRSMREEVHAAALTYGSAPFLVCGERRIGFDEFAQLAWGCGQLLVDRHGMNKGDRIGILALNRPEWLIALFGASAAGAITVGLNGWWHSEEIAYGLRDSGCRYLIVDEHLYDRVAPILDSIECLEEIFFIGEHAPPGTTPLQSLLVARSEPPGVALSEDDPFVILYTSGTTGRSKGCITTHRGTIAQVQSILHNITIGMLTAGDNPLLAMASGSARSALLTSPLFHVAGLHCGVCTALAAGVKLVFGPPKFDPDAVMRLIERERVTAWVAIPTLLRRLLRHPSLGKYDLSSLNTISTGGAPAAPELLQEAAQLLPKRPPAGTSYGLTECHGMACAISGPEIEHRRGSVGRVTPLLDIKVVDEGGNALPARHSGEICLRGVMITPGYWNRPIESAETIRDGWLHTGDIGHLDEDGYLYISDRAKDMILRSGENVYCVEIENCLNDHPEVEEAAVIGVPDDDRGERVKAIVRKRRDSDIDELRVKAHVAQHLANFKVPEIVEFIDQPLPRNPAGKLLKNLLRGEAVQFTQDQPV
jgi:long-chain acyl-CoA synthetase